MKLDGNTIAVKLRHSNISAPSAKADGKEHKKTEIYFSSAFKSILPSASADGAKNFKCLNESK